MQIIYLFCEHGEHRRGNCSRYVNHDVAWAFDAREDLVLGCACCVISGGQKYVQRTSAFPNHYALTFKVVTKLWQYSVSPWRYSFPNSTDRDRRFCLHFAETSCAQNLRTSQIQYKWTSKLTNPVEPFFKVSVHILMPIINTYLQKGCTSYYMPEMSKNEIAILKSNRGSLIR